MAMIQGTEVIEVAVPMKMAERDFVAAKQEVAIKRLNAEGKRVTHIEQTKRNPSVLEFSQYHVIVTLLWEADTESEEYKSFIETKEKEEAELRKRAIQEAERKKEAQKRQEIIEQNGQRESIWKEYPNLRGSILMTDKLYNAKRNCSMAICICLALEILGIIFLLRGTSGFGIALIITGVVILGVKGYPSYRIVKEYKKYRK